MFKKITHVIFDMDGVVLDSEGTYYQIISEICEQYGKKYTKEVRLTILGRVEADVVNMIVKELQLPITPEDFLKQYKAKCRAALEHVQVFPGADRLIRHLHKHNIPIGLATSSSNEAVEIKTKNCRELYSLFDQAVMGSSDPEVKNGKPSPDIFLVCASRFADKPDPEQCLVIEDAPNGVIAAVNAGMQVVMVPDPIVGEELRKPATQVLESLADFKPELFGLPAFEN